MSLKSVCSLTLPEKDFPKLMCRITPDTSVIILATGYHNGLIKGTVVGGTAYGIGAYRIGWDREFQDYYGSVTLTNE